MDLYISAGNRWMGSVLENYNIKSFEFSTNYYLFNKAISPFIGLGGGYHIKSFNIPFNDKYKEKGIGIKPRVGVLYDLNFVRGLKLNIQIYYNKVFTEHQINLYGINIGLTYYFEKK
jgi:hypothetical protein